VQVLVIAATSHELAWVDGHAPTLACGIGPVEAAAATAAALARARPGAVLHVGIAGGRGLAVGTVAIGARAVYDDLAAAVRLERSVEPAPELLAAARRALPDAPVVEIATSGGVFRSAEAPVEAMEGFGVLRAAALAGVPAIELRAVSNAVGEDDRSRWDVAGALAALGDAGRRLLAELQETP
jgi:futalosine hydrolase